MKQDGKIDTNNSKLPIDSNMRYSLAATICAQNRSRAEFIPNLQFGDPVWDLLLRIYTAEHLKRSTQPSSLAEQGGFSIAVVERCLNYLLKQEAIFENTNRYSNDQIPYLISEESKADIDSWLDNCFSNLQSGLIGAISDSNQSLS